MWNQDKQQNSWCNTMNEWMIYFLFHNIYNIARSICCKTVGGSRTQYFLPKNKSKFKIRDLGDFSKLSLYAHSIERINMDHNNTCCSSVPVPSTSSAPAQPATSPSLHAVTLFNFIVRPAAKLKIPTAPFHPFDWHVRQTCWSVLPLQFLSTYLL